jgi:large subunit ribosomal protein L19
LRCMMNTKILDKIDQEQKRKDAVPEFRVGDSLRIHVKIKEGDKERVQLYSGTVIARDGEGANETFTVRRVSYGEGIERIFPINAPSIAKIEVEKSGKVRRAKLYYLRDRTGKTSKVAEEEKETEAKPKA